MNESEFLACPCCQGHLAVGSETNTWVCRSCGRRTRGLRGIPDLRVGGEPALVNEDWAIATQLNQDFDRLDTRGLLERCYDLSPQLPADIRQRFMTHILTAPERGRRWLEAIGPIGERPLLELGCGGGTFLTTVGSDLCSPWGIDILMRSLLIARKRLDEAGLGHIRLVCCCAERLPFGDRLFGGIVAGDVIEHVADQQKTLSEAHRVLEPGGRLFMAVPNRFSITPEPHVGVWGVGFLPRRWMAPYVRFARGRNFSGIRSLSIGEWKRLLRQSPFVSGTIIAPSLPASDLAHFSPLKRRLGRVYNLVVGCRPGQAVARAVGPFLHVVCERQTDAGASGPKSMTAARHHRAQSASTVRA
jgi:SAM-dependent methyltransferase